MSDSSSYLEQNGIRPTAVRLLVWRTLLQFDYVFALSDLEGLLPTVDRSTLFRTLTLFVEHELLHTVDDGSGQQKYCLLQTQHVHLTCLKCGRTICLDQPIPEVEVPEGFEVRRVNYIIQGICAHCAHKLVDGHEAECCCHNHLG
ncbi:MAG: transcriptional repressor [Bacteroidales bacterium]|nr:transcriptional repressor [Bacteroidales bacterium]